MRDTLWLLLLPALAASQAPPSLDRVLERLSRLERENDALTRELAELRSEVASLRGGPPPPVVPVNAPSVEERLQIQERRTEEQAQTKVEAAQRFPVRLSGMLLANLFHNGPNAGANDTPTVSSRAPARQSGGFTFRQSTVGIETRGGIALWGASMKGSLFVDFFDGFAEATNFYPVRVRTASLELAWKTRTLSFVQDKPLFSQRDPTAFSYSGISPLTGSGNLWRWQPQLRFEQRVGSEAGWLGRLQASLIQTAEDAGFDFATRGLSFERRRPGLEGRFELSRHADAWRVEIAPGFHVSESHVNGAGFRSSLVSVDWLVAPIPRIEFSGVFWSGENIHHFGALRQSFRFDTATRRLTGVHARGGWAQLSFPFTNRFSLNLYGGIHDDRNADVLRTGTAANRTGAANIMYRIAPNVVFSVEALQNRTTYLDIGPRKNNRYDLSVAYLF